MGVPEALRADNQSLNRSCGKERDPLWLCLLQVEDDSLTVWVKVNVSVCAWLECMCLQMSEPVRKRDTVMCVGV